jgi:hypothetical protein
VQQAMAGVDFEKIGWHVDEAIHQAMHRYEEASSRPDSPAPPPPPPPAQPPSPPPPAQAAAPTGPGTMDILRAVERGEMTVDEALKRLEGSK